jgi:molybdenum cofactor biosynthesis enzyme MoaA
VRTKVIATNQTCNLACTFCTFRRPEDDPKAVSHAAMKARVAQEVGGDLAELVISGGEPGLRRDLAVLIRQAKSEGAKSVVLETNGTLIDEGRATALRDAGLDVARVHVPAMGPLLAVIAREESAPLALERGLHAIAAAGVALDIAIPIVRSNLASVASIPTTLAPYPVRKIWLRVPVETARFRTTKRRPRFSR